jgi:serine/threonine protein kinase
MPASTLVSGRYRLTEELGRGGMGVVWLAYDELLLREVAIKELRFPADLSADDRQRLAGRTLREARAVAAVETHAAVRVFDIVEQDDRPWIVMELVRGRTLTEQLRSDGPLPPREVARVGLALLEALEVAHNAGVLHRDVKPSNVLVSHDGRVALTDFGIATVDGDSGDTTSGVIVGSPSYVAPERVNGEMSSAASDLWSLGATLWTAAEGRAPYSGETAFAVMASVATREAPPCSQCDGRLAALLRQMMDRDPAQRPGIPDVRRVLEQVLADPTERLADTVPYPTAELPPGFDRTTVLEPQTGAHPRAAVASTELPATPPGPLSVPPARPSARPQRRGHGVAWLASGVVAVLVLAAVVAVLLTRSGDDPRTGTPNAGTTSRAPHRTPAASVPDGWTRYTDAEVGWAVAVPAGWQPVSVAEGTRFTDPAGGRYLLVATRYPAGSSAVGAWEDSERAFSQSHPGYQRLRLEPIDVAGARDAADWEFTYTDSAATLHALDRAEVFGKRGYALYFQTHSDAWDASRSIFDHISSSFQPG